MKKGETGQFKSTWWKSSQPKGLNMAGRLEMALKAYEASSVKVKAAPSDDTKKATLDVLDQVEQAVEKVVAEAKKSKAEDMVATVAALGKLDFKKERAEIEGLKGAKEPDKGAEDDDEGGDVADPKVYGVLLRKKLMRAKNADADKPMKFGFAVGGKRIDDRLVLALTGGGRELATKAGKEVGAKKITFGTAFASPDEADTLVLNIVGARLPGLTKKVRGQFKLHKSTVFKHVILMADGQPYQDEADPDDLEPEDPDAATTADPAAELARLRAEMGALTDRIRAAVVSAPDQRLVISERATLFRSALGKSDVEGATGALAGVRSLLEEIEARSKPDGASTIPKAPATAEDLEKTRQAWIALGYEVNDETDKLRAALDKEFGEAEEHVQVIQAFDAKVGAMKHEAFDSDIDTMLREASAAAKAGDGAARAKQVEGLKALMAKARAFASSEPFLADLDSNPFVPLKVQKILSDKLAELEAAIS